MAERTVSVERRGRVLIAGLRNPPHNFMTGAMVRELDQLVREVDGDDSTRAVILIGEHPDAFITHYDIEEIITGVEGVGRPVGSRVAGGALRTAGALGRLPGVKGALSRTPVAGLVELRRIHELFLRMGRSDVVFIAAINGTATGGGCELALACDVRIMAEGDHRIGLPEMTVGFTPGAGGTQRLSRLLGAGRALEMMLEGRVLPPPEAAAIGLVHRVVAPDALLPEALDTAERLARRAPGSIAALKRAVYEGGSRSLEQGLALERAQFLSLGGRPAAMRAMRGYVDELKRRGEPPWRDADVMAAWQEGRVVDMGEED